MLEDPTIPVYSKKDFMSDQTIRWCPGCGDYAILSQVQTVFAELGVPREKFAVISGIGCSSRFPYYLSTYGFHTIHGRAPAFVTGLRLANPELHVWQITGDGDALSIGGNHFIHLLRRNVDARVLLFNNRIYGLTKGQYSPTSEEGKKTKSTPMGSVDHPFTPCALALGADSTFVARTVDVFVKEQRDVLRAAHEHRGTAFVEILQNCNIFNDGAFASFTDKGAKEARCIFVQHGEPLIWGPADGPRHGLRLGPRLQLEAFELTGDNLHEALVHDETNPVLAGLLSRMDGGALPLAMGVLFRVQRAVYEDQVHAQIRQAQAAGVGDLQAALLGGNTWEVRG